MNRNTTNSPLAVWLVTLLGKSTRLTRSLSERRHEQQRKYA